jgi:hypothetical protein
MLVRWTKAALAWCLDNYHIIVPVLFIVAYVHSLIFFQYPGNFCDLDESVEPLQTLKFVHGKGSVAHKWGPLPHIIYAPFYAPWLGAWWLTGRMGKVALDYPYGFSDPFHQQGTLIVTARLVGLVVGCLAVAAYGQALRRLTGSRAAAFLALLLCVATAPDLIYKFVATKPDGLMNAFMMVAMAFYVRIVADGLTWRRGAWMSLFAVLSISCKEQTAPAFFLPYLGLAVSGWVRSSDRGRFVRDYAATLAAGVVSYLLINVVYAPSAYIEHVNVWLGPGKDPAIWAGSQQDLTSYLRSTFRGLLFNSGAGGVVTIALALLVSVVARVEHRVMLWLPAISYVAVIMLTAGYMPNYFMTPLNVLVAMPVAAVFAHLGARQAHASAPLRAGALLVLAGLVVVNAWTANLAWVRPRLLASDQQERYCLEHAGRDELVHVGNTIVRQSGSSRLSYLGFRVDDRALGEVLARPEVMPDVVLINRAEDAWLKDFRNRPAREAAFKEWSGYSYTQFEGLEPLGYRLETVLRPTLPGWLQVPWVEWSWAPQAAESEVLVYRRVKETEG